jgi:hypothetical protein
LERYISLYPSEKHTGNNLEKGKEKADEISSKTDERREELKSQVREAMRNREMEDEPEKLEPQEIGKSVGNEANPPHAHTDHSASRKDVQIAKQLGKKKGKHKTPREGRDPPRAAIEDDDFFGAD